MTKRYVFGPVASRRLGVSLGVDLVTRKSCSLNCIYCEAGETTQLTSERREYVPVAEVIAQLDEVLKAGPQLDFITFSGAGEPTLNSGIGQVTAFLKKKYPQYTICLLTNAVAFNDPDLLDEIVGIDLVVPSLDASSEEEFHAINRPAPGVTFAGLLAGLEHFCRTTRAKVYLELFIVPGVNDSDAAIARFAAIIRKLKVDKVQLNTLDRPGCVDWVKPSTAANTRRFIAALEPIVPVEAVGPFKYKSAALRGELPEGGVDARILDLASRRPVTVDDLAVALGAEQKVIAVRLAELVHRGLLESERQERGEFFRTNGSEAK
jgi:wyosine [tRNA(Phe)-imidazoG37] synthetase (radical SAM superfamily)